MTYQSPIPQQDSSASNRKMTYLPTTEAYDRWAQVYDTDGNILQALDDIQVNNILLPRFMSLLRAGTANDGGEGNKGDLGLRIVDLGCGTGRNTVKILSAPDANILGLDASGKMLGIAKERCLNAWEALSPPTRARSVEFEVSDMFHMAKTFRADGIVSTLVVEHIPLQTFFSVAAKMLPSGGVMLVTNMHADMGAKSQAGFVDEETGEKVRPVSYAHTVDQLIKVAKENGLDVVGNILEVAVDESMIGELGKRSEKWVGVRCWMGGIFQRHDGRITKVAC